MMNYHAAKLRGIEKEFYDNFSLKLSPPNVFIGGPVRVSPGFPLKACGNDGLWEDLESSRCVTLRGINP